MEEDKVNNATGWWLADKLGEKIEAGKKDLEWAKEQAEKKASEIKEKLDQPSES